MKMFNERCADELYHPAPTHLPVCAVQVAEYRSVKIPGSSKSNLIYLSNRIKGGGFVFPGIGECQWYWPTVYQEAAT
jgi:hypothetical protein